MNDLCLKFDSEQQAQQVLAACGLATYTPEHTETVPACDNVQWGGVSEDVAAELDSLFGSDVPRMVVFGDGMYRVDAEGEWWVQEQVIEPEYTHTVPASLRPAPGVCFDVIGVIVQPVGEPGPDGVQPTETLPGWHVNALLAGPVPEALQSYIVEPAQRVRVWA